MTIRDGMNAMLTMAFEGRHVLEPTSYRVIACCISDNPFRDKEHPGLSTTKAPKTIYISAVSCSKGKHGVAEYTHARREYGRPKKRLTAG